MPARIAEQFSFGGVDSRSNPTNFVPERSLRCKNFAPQQNGSLRLRLGYTNPTMSTQDTSTAIHSGEYFELWSGSQYVLFGQSTGLKRINLLTGDVVSVGTLDSSNPWNVFRANNKIFLGNGTDMKSYDGVTLRNIGIQAPIIKGSVQDDASNATNDASGGTVAWSNVTNALVSDDLRADVILAAGQTSQFLKITGFDFSAIPSNATLTGVQVRVESRRGIGNPSFTRTVYLVKNNAVVLESEKLVENKGKLNNVFDSNEDFGVDGDLWATSLVRADVIASTFGVAVRVTALGAFQWLVDYIRMKVFYIAPGAGVTVAASTAATGSFSATTLSGYQGYIAYRNRITQHVGNRAAVGSRVTIASGVTNAVLVFSGLPDLSTTDAEWDKMLARTPDGGEVPYAFIDALGNFIVAGNTATVFTVTLPTVDFNAELPTRNGVPPPMNRFARVLGRVFGVSDIEPTIIRYSEAEEDAVSGDFLGRPEESWPGNNAEVFPTGEPTTCLAEREFEGWFFSRNHLAIWSEVLRQMGANPWRGPWPAGCAGERAFTETPYGPVWLSGDKQLMTFAGEGPQVISEEYEKALLEKISDANLSAAEVSYLRDPAQSVDKVMVKGKDSSNNPVVVLHDMRIRDARSPIGQGYEYTYTGMTPNILVPIRDANKKQRLWCGDTAGKFHQVEDGNMDGVSNNTYTGDYIGLFPLGEDDPLAVEAVWEGDETVIFSYADSLDSALADFTEKSTETPHSVDEPLRHIAKIGVATNKLYYRFQLSSHPGDGDFSLGDPPYVPVNDYGVIYSARLKQGRTRPEGR